MKEAKTLGELRKGGRQILPVREEMRRNLVRYLESDKRILPGIVGYEDSVFGVAANSHPHPNGIQEKVANI